MTDTQQIFTSSTLDLTLEEEVLTLTDKEAGQLMELDPKTFDSLAKAWLLHRGKMPVYPKHMFELVRDALLHKAELYEEPFLMLEGDESYLMFTKCTGSVAVTKTKLKQSSSIIATFEANAPGNDLHLHAQKGLVYLCLTAAGEEPDLDFLG